MTSEDPQTGERQRAEIDAASADEALQGFFTKVDEGTSTEGGGLAEAQVCLLRAIYRELRHGHDQVAAHTAALAAHTKALQTNTAAMDEVYRALLDNGDRTSLAKPR